MFGTAIDIIEGREGGQGYDNKYIKLSGTTI